VAVLHSSLRVFVSLQQRLWADISASTSSVHAIFKDLPASSGLSDQPSSLAIETLHLSDTEEYTSAQQPAASPLVLYEGALLYQRAVIRTWASCYAVLTSDLHIHCFSATQATGEARRSDQLRPEQLLHTCQCAASPALLKHSDEAELSFEVFSVGRGLLSFASSGASETFRCADADAFHGWLAALEEQADG